MSDQDDTQPVKAPPTAEEVAAKVADNDGRLRALMHRYGVQFSPFDLWNMKFDALVTALFGPTDAEARRAFDWALAERMSAIVEDIEQQMTRAVLQQGTQPQGIVIPPNGYRVKNAN